jgi:hypothetical protein
LQDFEQSRGSGDFKGEIHLEKGLGVGD